MNLFISRRIRGSDSSKIPAHCRLDLRLTLQLCLNVPKLLTKCFKNRIDQNTQNTQCKIPAHCRLDLRLTLQLCLNVPKLLTKCFKNRIDQNTQNTQCKIPANYRLDLRLTLQLFSTLVLDCSKRFQQVC